MRIRLDVKDVHFSKYKNMHEAIAENNVWSVLGHSYCFGVDPRVSRIYKCYHIYGQHVEYALYYAAQYFVAGASTRHVAMSTKSVLSSVEWLPLYLDCFDNKSSAINKLLDIMSYNLHKSYNGPDLLNSLMPVVIMQAEWAAKIFETDLAYYMDYNRANYIENVTMLVLTAVSHLDNIYESKQFLNYLNSKFFITDEEYKEILSLMVEDICFNISKIKHTRHKKQVLKALIYIVEKTIGDYLLTYRNACLSPYKNNPSPSKQYILSVLKNCELGLSFIDKINQATSKWYISKLILREDFDILRDIESNLRQCIPGLRNSIK